MSPRDIYNLCIRRSVAINDTDSILKDRLRAHDRRKYGIEAPGSRLSPILLPSGPVSPLINRGSPEVFKKRPLVPIVKEQST